MIYFLVISANIAAVVFNLCKKPIEIKWRMISFIYSFHTLFLCSLLLLCPSILSLVILSCPFYFPILSHSSHLSSFFYCLSCLYFLPSFCHKWLPFLHDLRILHLGLQLSSNHLLCLQFQIHKAYLIYFLYTEHYFVPMQHADLSLSNNTVILHNVVLIECMLFK